MKKDILPRNSKNKAHGLWIFYSNNGKIRFKGKFINGLEHGYWIINRTMSKSKVRFYIK